MSNHLSKAEMIQYIEMIFNGDFRDEEIDDLLQLLKRSTGCPNISDLIFYSDPPLSPEEVIDKALDFKPIILPDPE